MRVRAGSTRNSSPRPEWRRPPLEDSLRALRQCTLFQDATVADLQDVLRAAQPHHVSKGGFYFQQGDRATTLHVLVSGKVKQIRLDPSGRQVILRFIHPAEPFGFDALIEGGTRRVAAQAAEDSHAISWDVRVLTGLMTRYPEISLSSLRLVVRRLVEVWDRLWDLSTAQVERRIARAVLRLKPSATGGRRRSASELAVSHQDLADLAGTTPYTVSRILRRWQRLGLVAGKRGMVRILRAHRLVAIAEEQWPFAAPAEYLP